MEPISEPEPPRAALSPGSPSSVKRNAHGGVHVDSHEIALAFQFFDVPSPRQNGSQDFGLTEIYLHF
jgi:hypothetical protein